MLILDISQTVYDMSSGGQYLNIGYEISTKVKEIVLPITSSIIGILLLLEVIKVVFGEGQVSWLKILKLLVFLAAFREYELLVKGASDMIQGILDGLSGYSVSETVDQGKFGEVTINYNVQMQIDNEFFIVSLAKKAMSLLQLISETLLIAMGPFAIMFSFIPGQDSVFNGWLRNLIHVLCWSITFMVLDMIATSITVYEISETAKALVKNGATGNAGLMESVSNWFSTWGDFDYIKNMFEAFLVKFIIALGYFSTPWLTSKYFGTSHSGGFTKQMLATAGGVYAGAKLAAGGAAKAVSPSKSSSNNETTSNVPKFGGSTSTSGVQVAGFGSKSSGSSNSVTPGFHKVNKSEN